MIRRVMCVLIVGSLAATLPVSDVVAQGAASGQTGDRPGLVPLKVDVTIARYDGDKRTSSTPFSLWVNANEGENTVLTTGQRIPIFTGGDVNYQSIGTDITTRAAQLADGRIRLNLTVQDSSLASARPGDPSPPATGPVPPELVPSMVSLRATNVLVLRDREVAEFLVATDKVTGEVTRISVVVTVLK